jgi:hypothetical protein
MSTHTGTINPKETGRGAWGRRGGGGCGTHKGTTQAPTQAPPRHHPGTTQAPPGTTQGPSGTCMPRSTETGTQAAQQGASEPTRRWEGECRETWVGGEAARSANTQLCHPPQSARTCRERRPGLCRWGRRRRRGHCPWTPRTAARSRQAGRGILACWRKVNCEGMRMRGGGVRIAGSLDPEGVGGQKGRRGGG